MTEGRARGTICVQAPTAPPLAMQVSTGLVRPILEELERQGVPRDAALRGSGIRAVDVEDSAIRIDRATYVRFVQSVIALSNDPATALLAGAHAPAETANWMSLVLLAAPSLGAIVELVPRYGPLFVGDIEWVLDRSERGTFVGSSRPLLPPEVQRFEAEMMVAFGTRKIVPHFLGPGVTPLEVRFRHEPPPWVAEYERVLRCPIVFGAEANGMLLDDDALAAPQRHFDPWIFDSLRRQADTLVVAKARVGPILDRAKALLLRGVEEGRGDVARIAGELGISARTLRRRMGALGKSPRSMLTEARIDRAQAALRDTDRSPSAIAKDLGFAEPSSFYRAFKRWTGLTPQQFRERSRATKPTE